jgi:hypothetical protein
MYCLSPNSFDRTLSIIEAELCPRKVRGCNDVPLIIKLCLSLHLLARGSYLHLLFAYDAPQNTLYTYAWPSLNAIDRSTDLFLNNIKSSIDCILGKEFLGTDLPRYQWAIMASIHLPLFLPRPCKGYSLLCSCI